VEEVFYKRSAAKPNKMKNKIKLYTQQRRKTMATITKENVESVIKYTKKYPNMSVTELAKLCGVSSCSVSNIRNGLYNHLLEETKENNEAKAIPSSIPYEDYKRLVACELCVKELFTSARKTLDDTEELFVDYRILSAILKKYFPEEYEGIRKGLYNN
jgi:hypothetical protein